MRRGAWTGHGADPRAEAGPEVGRQASGLLVEGMVRKARQRIKATRQERPYAATLAM